MDEYTSYSFHRKEEEKVRRTDREVTDMEEIKKVLDTCKVCRLGMSENGKIYIVPMNLGYVFEDGKLVLYFHGAKTGRKIEMIGQNPEVGFEMDCGHGLVEGRTVCQYSYYYASIIGNGNAKIVTDPKEKSQALSVIMKHQTGREFQEFEMNPKLEQAVTIIRVDVEEYSCKCHAQNK